MRWQKRRKEVTKKRSDGMIPLCSHSSLVVVPSGRCEKIDFRNVEQFRPWKNDARMRYKRPLGLRHTFRFRRKVDATAGSQFALRRAGRIFALLPANALILTPNHSFLVGARDVTIGHIAEYMPMWQDFGRPVVDRTGLTGTYDFSLDSVPERDEPSTSDADAELDTGLPTFSVALNEQLGLKLQPTRARVQVLIIDHVEQPSPN
jgi:uncharacterized protein (TIGR03435 family)